MTDEMEAAIRARDAGMALVDAHAHPAWKAMMDRTILDFARLGVEFGAGDVTAIVGMPANPNAIGARFSLAAQHGLIEVVSFGRSKRAARHAGSSRTWRGTAIAADFTPPIPAVKKTATRRRAPFVPAEKLVPKMQWRCTFCATPVAAWQNVQVSAIAVDPRWGEARCEKCARRRTMSLR